MDPITKLLSDEVKYESYVRSLTDDFGVVDRVLREDGINSDKGVDSDG